MFTCKEDHLTGFGSVAFLELDNLESHRRSEQRYQRLRHAELSFTTIP